MNDLIDFMQNVDAVAFLALGVVTAAIWLRDRDRSSGYLALAIVLLSVVLTLGRVMTLLHVSSAPVSFLNLLAFVGSGYALLSYRHALIPLSRGWRIGAAAVLVAIVGAYLGAMALSAQRAVLLWIAVALIVAWAATVLEPIIRFWLVARGLPTVQKWRLRSLSLGFAGLVGILLFALILAGARVTTTNAPTQLALQLIVLAIVPLLYVSFAPPAWLRREWRATEEEGLREFMESIFVTDEFSSIDRRALEWATRLTGGGGAISFDSRGEARASTGVDSNFAEELQALLPDLSTGIRRYERHSGQRVTLISLPIHSIEGIGHLVVVSGPFTPAIGNDELNRVQQFMTSVTAGVDRRRLVKELKDANRELKEASEHKSVFLANMSHELRTPLNAIIGFSELMLDAKESQFDSATQKRFLAQVHSSGKHLLGLINDILDLAKVEAGQMELRLQEVPVEPVIAQAIELVEPLAGQKQITIHADAGSAGSILADAGKLKQMLLNLLSNAIKFTNEGGQVSITARRVAGAIEVAVADTGIGISEADQSKIFMEFHQVDPGPGRRQQGTGLGLALTRRFALLHGGDVRLTSKVGQGSVFTLRLPIQVAPAAPQDEKVDSAATDPSRPLVLIIEDDVAAAELLTRQLQGAGFRTHVARTGTEAIAKARALHPAAITLDILLPELDGWEVMSRLKRDEETSSIPVVVVSVVDNPELGKALGALDYFVKPVDGKLLVDRLKRFKSKSAVEGTPTSVMVVDDEAANRHWLVRILEPAGFEVIEATGGREAIELAKARPPDLILLDLMMPEVTGFDVVEALRADPKTAQTPIMVLTARHLTEADKRHLNGHVSTILSRGSVGAADLLGLLQQVVDKANGKHPAAK
ncbi:MAG TPA: response regulator [Candidatus Dormibacteraeota bacterium]|nr:response regulator [Candidatus Dormibacteraeota bacterium]